MLSASFLSVIHFFFLRRVSREGAMICMYEYKCCISVCELWNCLSTYKRTSAGRFACHCWCQALYLQQEMGGAWTHLPCQSHRGQLRWRQAVTTMAIHQQAGSAGPSPPLAKTHIPVMPRTPAFHSHLWTAWPPATGLLHAPGHVCPCRGYTAHLHRALREQYSCTYLVVVWRQYEELWTGLFLVCIILHINQWWNEKYTVNIIMLWWLNSLYSI